MRFINRALVLFVELALFLGVASDGLIAFASEFQQVLRLAGIDRQELAPLAETAVFRREHWQTMNEIWYRLGQYSDEELVRWSTKPTTGLLSKGPAESLGGLYQISAEATLIETTRLPAEIEPDESKQLVYRCRFRSESLDFVGDLLTRKIPRRWQLNELFDESISFRGVLLGILEDEEGSFLMLTDRLAWYPQEGVPAGQLLLAKHGMDVSLLDDVVHRRPFVKPGLTMEAEAFYQCIKTLKRIGQSQLSQAGRKTVGEVAQQWGAIQPELLQDYEAKKQEMASAADDDEKKKVAKELKALRQSLSVANAVLKQADAGLSSLGPLYVQPEKEVGQLYKLEGIARRAVRINVPERPEIDHYYELEVFTPEAKVLEQRPIVCCVNRLPPDFPEGDLIREPVRITGVFLKSWLYRSRNIVGDTERAERLYTPLLLADVPTWIHRQTEQDSRWGLWGGIAFLFVLFTGWLYWMSVERQERKAKSAIRRSQDPEF